MGHFALNPVFLKNIYSDHLFQGTGVPIAPVPEIFQPHKSMESYSPKIATALVLP